MMNREYFTDENSIVREIWGNGDTILFIFAGAAAEFALNKAVDWLYFTGRLPKDPLGRLLSTVSYARRIVFSEKLQAIRTIDSIAAIHKGVEQNRGARIPDWAYRDVLFMLIDYSISAFELMERRMTLEEKNEVFNVFFRVGKQMDLQGLPQNFDVFLEMRKSHLKNDMQNSAYTADLFVQYRKHLGPFRYRILVESQILIIPKSVGKMLGLRSVSFIYPFLGIYKFMRKLSLDRLLKAVLLPDEYKQQIAALDKPKMGCPFKKLRFAS